VPGLGLFWAWTFYLCQDDLWFSLSDSALDGARISFLIVYMLALPLALFLISRFGQRLVSQQARLLCIVSALVCSSATTWLHLDLEPVMSMLPVPCVGALTGLLFGLAWAFFLCLWAQCSYAQPRLVATQKVAGSFILAGLLFFVLYYQLLPKAIILVAIPLLALLCLAFAMPHQSHESIDIFGSFESSHSQASTHLQIYAALIGFVWGVLPQTGIHVASYDATLGGIMVGVLFLLLVSLLKEGINFALFMALVAAILCSSIIIALLFPLNQGYSPYLVGACFQACYLLVLATGSARGIKRPQTGVALICRDIARFVLPITFGQLLRLVLGQLFDERLVVSLIVTTIALLFVIVQIVRKRTAFFETSTVVSFDTIDTVTPAATTTTTTTTTTAAAAASSSSSAAVPVDTPAMPSKAAIDTVAAPHVPLADADKLATTLSSQTEKSSSALLAHRHGLTARELDVMLLLSRGHSLSHIADSLYLSENTVKKHRSSLYAKIGIHKRQELINLLGSQLEIQR
jgi:DNA-binding CsgD family transcriptional regulator